MVKKKKTFFSVRADLVKALGKAREKFGTDGKVSVELGFSENYISNLRHSAKNNEVKSEKMAEVTKQVSKVIGKSAPASKKVQVIDLSKVVKKAAKKKAKAKVKKKVAKVVKKKVAKKKVAKKKVVLGARDRLMAQVGEKGPFFAPIKVELKEEMIVHIGKMTFVTEVTVGETIDVTVTRGKSKMLARL